MTDDQADDLVVTEDQRNSQFTLARRDGTVLASMDYNDNGQTFTVLRVFTVPQHRGNGYAARLVEQVVERIAPRGEASMASVCWFASEWFDEHPEHQHLLR